MNSRFDVLAQLSALRRYARSLTRDQADAEDLVQDALTRAYERRATYRDDLSLRSWLLAILHNSFIDQRRSRRASQERDAQVAALSDTSLGPEQPHMVRLRQVEQAFRALPDEQRAALHLVAIDGLTYSEAAAALGIPVGTLTSRLARARAHLRALEDGPDAGQPNAAPMLRVVGGTDGAR